jgi:hypothetical protein
MPAITGPALAPKRQQPPMAAVAKPGGSPRPGRGAQERHGHAGIRPRAAMVWLHEDFGVFILPTVFGILVFGIILIRHLRHQGQDIVDTGA